MKRILLIFILFLCVQDAYSFNIVYPKGKDVTLASKTTFFVGSSDKPVKINGQEIPLHSTGAFSYVVNLQEGKNTFNIQTDTQRETYIIKSVFKKNDKTEPKLKKFGTILQCIVDTDKATLRYTPANSGMNRLGEMQKGVILNIDAEKGEFYRVKLDDKYVWVLKNSVKKIQSPQSAHVAGISYDTTNSYYIITFKADKKVPYEIIEGEDITLKFYDTVNGFTYIFPYKKTTKSENIVGYSGQYTDDNKFILKIRKYPKVDNQMPLKNLTIAVDAGHGGERYGAIGPFGDKEKDIVMKISQYLSSELQQKGANVIMTRNSDINISLNDRVKIANDSDAIIFVSIHNNALPDTLDPNKHRGTSVYYYYPESKKLAESILNSMIEKAGTNNDGVRQQSFAVIRNSQALSVLVEVAYLINSYDNELLLNTDFQKKSAKAIADGIENYFK